MGKYATLLDRLKANSEWDEVTGCWTWTGVQTNGYPRINIYVKGKTRTYRAHRVSLEIHLGRLLDPGYEADHRCHNTLCINPHHLQEVDAKTNANNRRNSGKPHVRVEHRFAQWVLDALDDSDVPF